MTTAITLKLQQVYHLQIIDFQDQHAHLCTFFLKYKMFPYCEIRLFEKSHRKYALYCK